MTLKEMQKLIIENRIRRNWPSATDLTKTTCGIAEELGEFERARRHNDIEGMIDALGDIGVYCLGGLEILNQDSQIVLENIVENNNKREGQKDH